MTEDTDQTPTPPRAARRYQRPSERMFRRSRAAQARRREKDKSDFRLISALLQVSVLAALVLVGAGVFAQRSLNGRPVDISIMSGWVSPWIGPVSKLEVAGFVLIAALCVYLLLRWKKR